MDIHHLKIFYETCNEKSFTKAAKKLYISQSAVSIQLKKLEESLSVQLIERNSKKFKLTFAGMELYRLSQEIFNKIARMENEIQKVIINQKTKIIIGATHNIGEPMLPKIMLEYSKKNPNIEFDIHIKNSASLINLLKEGIIDIALLEEEMPDENEIKFIQTDIYPFVVIAPSGVDNLEEIKNLPFLKKDTSIISNYIEEFENLINHSFSRKMIVNGSNETIKDLVISGFGISILPYYCVYEELKEKKISFVHEFDTLETKFQIAFLRDFENKNILSEFIEFFREYNIKYESDTIIKKNKIIKN